MPVTEGQCTKMHKCEKNFNMADKYTVSGALEQLDNVDVNVNNG